MMAADQPTGAIDGVVITGVLHEGLSISVNGKPGHLAIVDDEGHIVAAGELVEQETEAVVINVLRNFMKGQGWLRVHRSLPVDSPVKAMEDIDHAAFSEWDESKADRRESTQRKAR